MEITTILWMFMLGCAVAVVIVYYNNRFLGRLVRALIDIEATSPETAMPADELEVKVTPALKRALRPGTSFSEIVIKTEDDRFYIAPDKVALAKAKYRSKETTIIFVVMSLIILALAAVALSYVFPVTIERFTGTVNEIFGEVL